MAVNPEPPASGNAGRLRFIRPLGGGGQGEVWEGELQGDNLPKRVAIKLVASGSNDPRTAARIRDEGRALAALRHRAIVRVEDFVWLEQTPGGGPRWALVTELIEGADLDEAGRHGPVPLRAIVEIIAEVADALACAHANRAADGKPAPILHRDVKPANIRLGRDGAVKLIDFGVARSTVTGREVATVDGLVGTHEFIAPEVWATLEYAPPVDVFGLGVTLILLATGAGQGDVPRPLHPRRDWLAARAATLPPALAALARAAIAFEPSRRCDAPTLADGLRRLAPELPGEDRHAWMRSALATPVPPSPRVGTPRETWPPAPPHDREPAPPPPPPPAVTIEAPRPPNPTVIPPPPARRRWAPVIGAMLLLAVACSGLAEWAVWVGFDAWTEDAADPDPTSRAPVAAAPAAAPDDPPASGPTGPIGPPEVEPAPPEPVTGMTTTPTPASGAPTSVGAGGQSTRASTPTATAARQPAASTSRATPSNGAAPSDAASAGAPPPTTPTTPAATAAPPPTARLEVNGGDLMVSAEVQPHGGATQKKSGKDTLTFDVPPGDAVVTVRFPATTKGLTVEVAAGQTVTVSCRLTYGCRSSR